MALSRVKTWIAGETLSASDLNTEFSNIITNPMSLISPLTGSLDIDGNTLTLDGAAATQLVSSAAVSFDFTSGAKTGTPGSKGSVANWSAQTFTDSNTGGSGTATKWFAIAFQRPTLAAINSSVTTTDAATVYIPNAPAAGSNQTLTNALALWIDDGKVRIDPSSDVVSASGAVNDAINITAQTTTISGSTNITTAAGVNLFSIKSPTLSSANALTITNAATLYISDAPAGGGAGPATITNAYALWVDAGSVRFDGDLILTGNLNLPVSSDIVFEGATDDEFETTLTAEDPDADRTWTLGNITGRIWNLPAGIGPVPYAGATVPTGWLECDGSAVSRSTYAALFTAIATTWGAGDGSTTFNLPDMRGRVSIGAGRGTVTESGVNAGVNITTNRLTVASNDKKWVTGMLVRFNLTSGTITGLTDDAYYFVIRTGTTSIRLASTLANAQNGVSINFTAKSNPVWDITHFFQTRTLGDQGGEESHAASKTETLAHTHNVGHAQTLWVGQGAVTSKFAGNAAPTTNPQATSSVGGNQAANIMQPFAVTKMIISY